MAGHDVIVVGASAGGVEALRCLVQGLPPDLPATLFVALHMGAGTRSVLPAILERAGPLPAQEARNGAAFAQGHIYVAPPDYHLLVDVGHMRLEQGPRENGHRPAIDGLYCSLLTLRVRDVRPLHWGPSGPGQPLRRGVG